MKLFKTLLVCAAVMSASPSFAAFTLYDISDGAFSDGTPFDAEAVCANFTRMFEQKGAGQTAAEYWGYFFGSFSDKPEGSLYKSCEAKDASTAVINITRSTSSFPTILSLDSFSMQSPMR